MKRSVSLPRRESQIPVRSRPRSSSAEPDRASIARSNIGRSLAAASPGPASRSSRNFTSPGRSPNVRDNSRVDTRPLQDKNYQTSMCVKIDNYFKSIGRFDLLLKNPKNIPLSITQFVEMTTILLEHMTLKHNLTPANYIDEIPKIAEQLKYKGIVKPSWLKTPFLLSALPYSLGWLSHWVTLVNVYSKIKEKIPSQDAIPFAGETAVQQHTKRALLKFGISGYLNFNRTCSKESDSGSSTTYEIDDKSQELFEQIQTSLDLHDQGIEAINKKLLERQKTLESLRNNETELKEQKNRMTEKLRKLQNERNQCLQSIEAKKLRQCQVENTIIEKLEGIKEFETQREKKEVHINALREQIKSQVMSCEERNEILEQCVEKKKELKQYDKNLEVMQAEAFSLDMQLTKMNTSLEKKITAFNDTVAKNYSTCLNSTGQRLEDLQLPVSHLSDPQVWQKVKEKQQDLKTFCQGLKVQIDAKRNSLKNREAKCRELEQELEKAEKIRDTLKLNAATSKQKIKERNADLQKQITFLEESIENLKKEFEELQNSMPDMKAAEAKLNKAQEEYEAEKAKSEQHLAGVYKIRDMTMANLEKQWKELLDAQLKLKQTLEKAAKKEE